MSPKGMDPRCRLPYICRTHKLLEADKPGQSPTTTANLDSQFEKLEISAQDDQKLFLPIDLKNETSPLKLSMNSPINLQEQPEEGVANVSHDDATATATFNALPTEIRVKIYAMCWEPRRVRLARSWLEGPDDLLGHELYARTQELNVYDSFDEDDVTTVSTSTAPLPVTLWINQESRFETLRHYKIAFACPRNGSSQVYFNFRIDELEIRQHGDLRSIINKEDLGKLKALIIPVGYKEARSASTTMDKLRNIDSPITNLDAKLHQLHSLGLGLSAGMEPYDPENPSEDGKLRRVAERLQREIAVAFDLPPNLSSVCPRLERVRLEPTTTCGYWPTENFATQDQEDSWFLSGQCECLTCTYHWAAGQFAVFVAHVPEEQAWSVGDVCPPEQGEDREARLGQITVTWRALVDTTAGEPEDETRARRAVADWAVAAKAIADKLADAHDGEPSYVI